MSCLRCRDAKEKGVVHSYQWTPPETFDCPPLFFNVAEIRFYIIKDRIECIHEEYAFPYMDDLVGLTGSHEITYDHILHIPEGRIRPSLVGNLMLKNKETGIIEPVSLMLDGHHSAMNCMFRKAPVRVAVLPVEFLERMAYRSMEELLGRPLMILEGV